MLSLDHECFYKVTGAQNSAFIKTDQFFLCILLCSGTFRINFNFLNKSGKRNNRSELIKTYAVQCCNTMELKFRCCSHVVIVVDHEIQTKKTSQDFFVKTLQHGLIEVEWKSSMFYTQRVILPQKVKMLLCLKRLLIKCSRLVCATRNKSAVTSLQLAFAGRRKCITASDNTTPP